VKRRLIWLAAGVTLGVVGYRRFDRVARSLTGPSAGSLTVRPTARQSPLLPEAANPAIEAGHRSVASVALGLAVWGARRIRAGHSAGRDLSAQTAAFLGEVRAGMAEYLEDHDHDAGRLGPGEGSRRRAILAAPGPGTSEKHESEDGR
jgi:hypothetical protein